MAKITKREMFEALFTHFQETGSDLHDIPNEKVMDFIVHEIDLLEKKNSGTKKPTAQQTANIAVKEAIFAFMAPSTLYTVTDIQKNCAACADITNQRVSALLRQMIEDGLVARSEDKRKAYFSKVCAEPMGVDLEDDSYFPDNEESVEEEMGE
jgi:hypothetical protein